MDRRRFLKYAGATAAVVGASALGANYLTEQSPSITSQTLSTTLTPRLSTTTVSSTSSSESVQLASLQGRLFFDYNGNGKQEDNEPSVSGAKVQLKNYLGNLVAEAATDSSGVFKIEDVPVGNYMVFALADSKFHYMCRSAGEVTSVGDGYTMSLTEGLTQLNVGLMEGFLTLPFPKGIPINIEDYFFHGNAPPRIWWDGTKLPGTGGHNPPWAHPEEDFLMPIGTELRAAMPGKIQGINYNPTGPVDNSDVYWISLFNDKYQYGTTCLHIKEPLLPIGSVVNRGDSIALSGDTGTGSPGIPHTAFQIWKHLPDGNNYCVDPYSPVAGVPKGAWIAGTWQWYPSDEEWVSQGYWTKDNDPQYAIT